MRHHDKRDTRFDLAYFERLDRLRTIDEAASIIRVTASTLRRWLREGRIRGHALNPEPWTGVLAFAGAAPVTYVRVREVLRDADARRRS